MRRTSIRTAVLAAGDTTGQGVQGVWWVVAPNGSKIAETAAPAAGDGY